MVTSTMNTSTRSNQRVPRSTIQKRTTVMVSKKATLNYSLRIRTQAAQINYWCASHAVTLSPNFATLWTTYACIVASDHLCVNTAIRALLRKEIVTATKRKVSASKTKWPTMKPKMPFKLLFKIMKITLRITTELQHSFSFTRVS